MRGCDWCTTAVGGGVESSLSDRIADLVQTHHTDPNFDVTALAKALGISPCYVYEVCALNHGKSPHDFIEQCRMDKALELIRGGEPSLFRVCAACGYANYQTFRKAFYRRMGIAPSHWRGSVRDDTRKKHQRFLPAGSFSDTVD
jgi:AraC-like DNA-binding protein